MRFPRLTIATAAVSLALVTGCAGPASAPVETTTPPAAGAPSATPEATASATPDPEPEALIISTAGLDAVKLNAPVPADLAISTWDPDFCPGGTGAFVPAGAEYGDDFLYTVRTEGGTEKGKVNQILVFTEDIVTPSGVHVGMSLATVKKILPEMKLIGNDEAGRGLYVVKDELGQLVFEFAEGDELKDMQSLANSLEPHGYWYSDAGGSCPA